MTPRLLLPRRLRLLRSLLPRRLLHSVPVKIPLDGAFIRLGSKRKYVGPARLVRAVRPGMMQRAPAMNRRPTGWYWTCCRRARVQLIDLQSVNPRIIIDAMVRLHLLQMTPGNELHAAILQRRILQRNPDAHRV